MCWYSLHGINSQTKRCPADLVKSVKINVTKTSSLCETMLEVKVEHEIHHEICPHSAHILERLWNWMTIITILLGQTNTKHWSTANKKQASKIPNGPFPFQQWHCKYWATLRQWRNTTFFNLTGCAGREFRQSLLFFWFFEAYRILPSQLQGFCLVEAFHLLQQPKCSILGELRRRGLGRPRSQDVAHWGQGAGQRSQPPLRQNAYKTLQQVHLLHMKTWPLQVRSYARCKDLIE